MVAGFCRPCMLNICHSTVLPCSVHHNQQICQEQIIYTRDIFPLHLFKKITLKRIYTTFHATKLLFRWTLFCIINVLQIFLIYTEIFLLYIILYWFSFNIIWYYQSLLFCWMNNLKYFSFERMKIDWSCRKSFEEIFHNAVSFVVNFLLKTVSFTWHIVRWWFSCLHSKQSFQWVFFLNRSMNFCINYGVL